MSKTLKWIIGVVVVLLAGLVVLTKMGTFGKDEGTKVTSEKVQKRTITEIVNASGKIYPEIEVKVSPDISGEITELNVQEGDTVKKGQVLARIFADLYDIQRKQAASGVAQSQAQVNNSQAALDALKANMEQAEKTFTMQKTLFADKVISQNEFNVADAAFKTAKANYNAAVQGIRGGQASVQSAKASLSRADKDVNRATIVAPMDGVVSLLNVKKGERVVGTAQMAGTEILRVANLHNMEVEVDVNENDIVKIKVGDEAKVEVDAYLKKEFKGVVTSIANSASSALTADQVTNFKVKVRILKESYQDLLEGKPATYFPFRPGMTATVDIITKTKKNVVAVPISSVVVKSDTAAVKEIKVEDPEEKKSAPKSDKKFECVFVKVGDKAKIRVIKTGIQDDSNIEVLTGLKKGDVVITGPYTTVSKELNSGDKVKIKKDKK